MSNIIPPLLSDTPPPPPDINDHEDEDFDDFTGTNNLSYDCDDSYSPPGSPLQLPTEQFELDDSLPTEIFDINSNSKENIADPTAQLDKSKDFHDKRKDDEGESIEKIVNNDLIQDPVLPIAKSIVQDTQPIVCSNSIAQFSPGSYKETDDSHDFTELKNDDIIVTNCDTKTTSSQKEIISLSSEENVTSDDFADVNSDSVNNKTSSYDCANSIINNIQITLKDSNFSNEPSIQSENTSQNDVKTAENSDDLKEELNEISLKSNILQNSENLNSQSKEIKLPYTENIDVLKLTDPIESVDDFGAFIDDSRDIKEFDLTKSKFGDLLPSEISNELGDDEFGDFSSVPTSSDSQNTLNIGNSDFGDFSGTSCLEFEKFATFSAFSQNINPSAANDDDDFGDFATSPIEEYSESALYSKLMLLNEKQALEKSTEIVKEMFPIIEQSKPDFEYKGLEVDDKIFNQVKNITDTHALLFQWPKSASQNLLLKALNIDSRNILYGPGWNPSMPRFAANLSLTPLEPVKSEVLTPTPAAEPNSTNSTQSAVNVEAFQFDSSETGLDSIPAKPKNTVEAPTNCSVLAVQQVLNSVEPHIQGSKNDLEQTSDDFDDFVSYSTPTVHVSPIGHNIILRETHISNKESSKGDESDIVSWLEPTIVTPELARKERQFVEADEEFDDFPMVVVPEDVSSKPAESVNSLTVKPLEVLQPQSIIRQDSGLQSTSFSETSFQNNKEPNSSKDPPIDDDFGDFKYSLPSEMKPIVQPLSRSAPLLEPLKPSVIQTSNATSISWPDPGITDDEISRLEALGYARAQNQQPEPSKNNSTELSKSEKPTRKSKQNSLDDEEWSDFVSGQNSSPLHKLKAEKERSSTPDLPLSVLNLGNIQPAKQPIPVITQNGLVQTKLSSNMSLNIPNMMQQANRIYPQPQARQNIQPSIISSQYATQAYGGFGNYGSSRASGDEDEWSDFVSHQPTVQKNAQPKSLQGWSSQHNQLANWVNTTPNIITNPAANFDIFGSSKNVPGPVQSRRGTGLPSVSVPDHDFLAPRNRTTQRK